MLSSASPGPMLVYMEITSMQPDVVFVEQVITNQLIE